MNIKKSQGRFLSPIGNENGPMSQSPGLNHAGHGVITHPKMPSTVIDKYPNTSKPEVSPIQMPRAIRETKNNQLFEKYMNRQHAQNTNRKPSVEPTNSLGGAKSSIYIDENSSNAG